MSDQQEMSFSWLHHLLNPFPFPEYPQQICEQVGNGPAQEHYVLFCQYSYGQGVE